MAESASYPNFSTPAAQLLQQEQTQARREVLFCWGAVLNSYSKSYQS